MLQLSLGGQLSLSMCCTQPEGWLTQCVAALATVGCCSCALARRFSHPNIQVVRSWVEVEAAVAAMAAVQAA